MFLKKLQEQNPQLINAALKLHQQHQLEPDTYVLDYDAIMDNVHKMVAEANAHGVKLYAMTKQFGRIPFLAQKIIEAGFCGVVCVDYREASLMIDHGVKIGNVGHLVQIPDMLLEKIIKARPEVITVYSIDKIRQINNVALKLGLIQPIMLKVYQNGDNLYSQQEAGFQLDELTNLVHLIEELPAVKIVGVTHFPCFLYDKVRKIITHTQNADTVLTAAAILQDAGIAISQINLPSSTCIASIAALKSCGGTHGEPGHGLTGTTMYHADNFTGEAISSLYLSEISHHFQGQSYCFGGGHYRRSLLQNALVNGEMVEVHLPDPEAIDYHFKLSGHHPIGAPVIMSFRTQIFVTRSHVALLTGVNAGNPIIIGRYDSQGRSL